MKKLLFFITTVSFCTVLQVNAQTVVFEENFDSVTPPALPTGWTTGDRDGDGKNWQSDNAPTITNPYGFSGGIVGSLSYSSTPDNLLITPSITVPAGNPSTLTFLIGGFKNDALVANPHEHYAVYVLPAASTFQGTESPVLEESLPNAGTAYSKSINLSTFAGQAVKIYFRHFNSNNQLLLILDQVKVTQGSLGTSETDYAKTNFVIYPNPSSDYVYLKSDAKITKAEILELSGRKTSVKMRDGRIDVRQLPAGTYLITAEAGNKKYSQKLIKK